MNIWQKKLRESDKLVWQNVRRFVKPSQTTSKFSTNHPKKLVLYCKRMWIWKEIALEENAHFKRTFGELWKKCLEIHKQTTSKKNSSNHGDSPVLCCLLLPACLSYLLGLKVRSITKHRPDLLYASLLHTSALFSAHCSRKNLMGVTKLFLFRNHHVENIPGEKIIDLFD